jgi:hypothetical protein
MTSHTFVDVMKKERCSLNRFRGGLDKKAELVMARERGRGRGWDGQGGRRGAAATAARHLFVRIPNNRSQGSRERGPGVGDGGGKEPWMKEEKGIRHRGEGAYLRCPVSTSVQFSLRDEGSSEYICVCEGRESLRPNF